MSPKPDPGAPALRLRGFFDYFPFGAAPFVIFVMTLLCGGYLLLNPAGQTEADLRLLTFTNIHEQAYKTAAPEFTRKTGTTVRIDLSHNQAVRSKLRSAFWAGLDVPELVEIEITWAGSFFRGPVEDVGFIDLKPYLVASGLLEKFPESRMAAYTNRGRIFGIPHDVHPVMLAYRADIVEDELGIDVAQLDTWEKFVEAGRRITIPDQRYMLNLDRNGSSMLEILMFQRGGGYFDAEGNLTMDSDIVLQTLLWYVPKVAGKDRISEAPGMFGQTWAKSVEDGLCLFFFCPDWKSKSTEKDVASMSGKMKLMPLPAWEPGGRRTSTWGGTMLGITKKCKDKDTAWALAKYLYTDPAPAEFLFRQTNILPPMRDNWKLPAIQEPREYWSGQRLGAEYAALADDVPPQYSSPFIEMAKQELGNALARCVARYENQGPEGFEDFARAALKESADYVRKHMERNPF